MNPSACVIRNNSRGYMRENKQCNDAGPKMNAHAAVPEMRTKAAVPKVSTVMLQS